MAAKISDKALLKIIQEQMNADRICEQTNITLKTLQTRVAKLTVQPELHHNPQNTHRRIAVQTWRPVRSHL